VCDWGHVKTAVKIERSIRVNVVWAFEKNKSFRTQTYALEQIDGFSSFFYLCFKIYFRLSTTKSNFREHRQLIDNGNHRKEIRTCFGLCYSMTRNLDTFKYAQKKTRSEKPQTQVHWYHITNE
jgi:hypothetical protein